MFFMRGKTLWVSLLILVWLSGSLVGLWWFQSRLIQPFVAADAPAQFRDLAAVDQALRPLLTTAEEIAESVTNKGDNRVTLVHLWNPDCGCNSVSQRHLDATLEAFGPEQLRFVILAPASASADVIAGMQSLNDRAEVVQIPEKLPVPISASPGLAMYSPSGELAYFGAYGFGALCTLSDSNLFVNMVSTLLSGKSYGPFMNIAGSGCFCNWPQP